MPLEPVKRPTPSGPSASARNPPITAVGTNSARRCLDHFRISAAARKTSASRTNACPTSFAVHVPTNSVIPPQFPSRVDEILRRARSARGAVARARRMLTRGARRAGGPWGGRGQLKGGSHVSDRSGCRCAGGRVADRRGAGACGQAGKLAEREGLPEERLDELVHAVGAGVRERG